MQIRRVTASNYRGIREAEWRLPVQRFVCLVGPGDSTKTTLLDLIASVLSPRWNMTFTDADFYQCDTSRPITLRVLIGDLSDEMIADTAFGMYLTGLTSTDQLEHDPSPESEACVLLQLRVEEDLEPHWTVVRHGEYDDGLPISGSKRGMLGLFRVDDRVDTHLRWGRGSALARLTGKGASQAVTAVQRASRDAVFEEPLQELHETARLVAAASGEIGGGRFVELRPGWDPVTSASPNALLLHEGTIPLTYAGLGTRRLTSIAAQAAAQTGDILLVDEIEHGLEPHRLLHVLHRIKQRCANGRGQVIVTTHSPIAVEALGASDIGVVRNMDGLTEVRPVPTAIAAAQGALRACPSAILARRVVIGEGATEAGILRSLIRSWDDARISQGEPTHAALGATFLNGGGAEAPIRAKVFQDLGYATLLLIDNDDRGVDKAVQAFRDGGGQIARWQKDYSTEVEIILSLDEAAVIELLNIAVDIKTLDAVANHMTAVLPSLDRETMLDPQAWAAAGYAFTDVRTAVAVAAGGGLDKEPSKRSKKAWFKREDAGEMLGAFILGHWSHYREQHLGRELMSVHRFIYGDEEQSDSDQ
jgi:putative ATP-dependent endonuclease of the OLD family